MKTKREVLAAFLLDLRSQGITEHRLMSAFEAIPRRNFVPVIHISEAYVRGQMPIECGQTMTAVDMVAKVLSIANIQAKQRVLEIGSGTGYQTALISQLAEKVVSLERYRTLKEKAQTRLGQLNITNVIMKLQDGSEAGAELGVHDRIIANCAFEEIPRKYADNLAINGIMVAPVGPPDGVQMMKKFTKIGVRLQVEDLFEVRMQPFINDVAKAI